MGVNSFLLGTSLCTVYGQKLQVGYCGSQQLFAWYISLYSLCSETPSRVLWESTAFCLVHLSVQFMLRNSKWGTVGVNSFLLGTSLCTVYGQRPKLGYCGRRQVTYVENPELTNVFHLNPGVGQNITTHASPSAQNVFLGSLFSFLPSWSIHFCFLFSKSSLCCFFNLH